MHIEFNYEVIKDKKIIYFETSKLLEDFQIQMMESRNCPNLLNLEVLKSNEISILKYDITDYINLKTYFRRTKIKKIEFIVIVREIITIILEATNYYLDWENFLFNSEFLFIDIETLEIKIIYIPFKEVYEDKFDFNKFFFFDFLGSVKFNEDEDFSFIIKIINLINFYEDKNDKSMLKKIINILNFAETEINHSSEILIKEDAEIYEKDLSLIEKVKSFKFTKKIIENNFRENIFKKTKETKETKETREDKFQNDNILSSTVILKKVIKSYCLQPIDSKYESIDFLESNRLIGRNKRVVDVFINNVAIGKIHGEILKKNNDYYIKDMNTLNGTFINNKKLKPFNDVKINLGDIVRLADVEYIFELK